MLRTYTSSHGLILDLTKINHFQRTQINFCTTDHTIILIVLNIPNVFQVLYRNYNILTYLTYMQSTSWETLGSRKYKLESRLPGEISITSDMQSEKAMATHSSTLAWKIPWMEKPGRLQSMGSLRVGHDWATSLSLFTFLHWRRKWQSTPVFLPGESQGLGSLVGCHLWGRTELDTTEVT